MPFDYKQRSRDRKAAGLCSCGRPPTPGKTRCEDCRVSGNKSSVRLRRLLKPQAINAYGGRCECCGETHIIFLTIDHADEVRHLKKVSGHGDQLHKWLRQNIIHLDLELCASTVIAVELLMAAFARIRSNYGVSSKHHPTPAR